MAASYQQARRYERAPIRERAILVHNGVSYNGVISRIGGGGVFFETPLELPRGENVLLKFRIACLDDALVVKGEVRWAAEEREDQPAGLGLAFIDLDPKKRARIVEFVAERGEVLSQVNGLLEESNADLARMKDLLAKVDLDSVSSLEDLRTRVKNEMAGFFVSARTGRG